VTFAGGSEVTLVTMQNGALVQGDASGQHVLQTGGVVRASAAFPPFGEVVDIIFQDGSLWQFDPFGAHRIGIIG
jgi:hypothetical protein